MLSPSPCSNPVIATNLILISFFFQVTYDYPFLAAFRKPLTIFGAMVTVFVTAWGIGKLDVSIKKR